ncbi:hypothetical protein ATKI12_8800 [Kitasatospora sp. Ki12]
MARNTWNSYAPARTQERHGRGRLRQWDSERRQLGRHATSPGCSELVPT